MPARGLLFRGQRVQIPGIEVIGPGDADFCTMSPRDYMTRKEWPRQIFAHTTKGIYDPKRGEIIIPGKGPGGKDKSVSDYWSTSDIAGGAPLIVDDDGSIACLQDLALYAAYHATTSNKYSIGIEMLQRADGGVYQATLTSTVILCMVLSKLCGIPFQIPSRKYNNDAIDRMKFDGGPTMVGTFGHRDNAWDFVKKTSSRGRGDPGDMFYAMCADAGAERLDYQSNEDLKLGMARQEFLNGQHGAGLKVDGVAGPGSNRAMLAAGYKRWRDVPVLEAM